LEIFNELISRYSIHVIELKEDSILRGRGEVGGAKYVDIGV
jgi:hypothetical protein